MHILSYVNDILPFIDHWLMPLECIYVLAVEEVVFENDRAQSHEEVRAHR